MRASRGIDVSRASNLADAGTNHDRTSGERGAQD